MYAFSNSNRIYTLIFLCLCAAFLLAPTVANASDGYWSTQEKRFISQSEATNRVNRMLSQATSYPSGSTLSTTSSAPTVSKNPTGGLSASTNQVLRTMGQPSGFSSTSNFSLNSAKTALKSCVRSPSCAGRALGGGAIIYEGIQGWKDVYDFTLGDDNQIYKPSPNDEEFPADGEKEVYVPPYSGTEPYVTSNPDSIRVGRNSAHNYPVPSANVLVEEIGDGAFVLKLSCPRIQYNTTRVFVGWLSNTRKCQFSSSGNTPESNKPKPLVPASPSELDNSIDEGYEPAASDAPIVLLSDTAPATIELSTPAPVELSPETKTITDSNGQTSTAVTNRTITYNVTNNNTATPSISSTITETTNTYDQNSNLVNTSTSTKTDAGVQHEAPAPSAPLELDFELPSFCSWASIVCDWIGWTKEGIEGEEPDLINLISEFEPYEHEYNSSIGSGSCPAPMSLNLGIINRTVEVSYQPFCDFLDMIRPLVIAGAWLLSAFMYVGVLRRG